jgi:hypothetical protein
MEIKIDFDIRTVLAFVSTLIAILSYFRGQTIKKQTIAHLWSLFKKQQNNYSITQSALAQYKVKYATNSDIDLLWTISRTEAFDQNIMEDIMLHITFLDTNLTNETIELYRQQNRISDYDVSLFKAMINKPKKNLFDKLKDFFGQ